MPNSTEIHIKNALQKIDESPKNDLESAVTSFLNLVVDLYKSGSISSEQLGYYVTSLVQYEDNFTKPTQFSEITKISGLLELPPSQLEEKGFSRKDLLENLLEHISGFVG